MGLSLLLNWLSDISFDFCVLCLKKFPIYNCDAIVILTFRMGNKFYWCILSNKKALEIMLQRFLMIISIVNYLAEHSILSGIFII